ncbi:MAG: PQQ-binding-like beta-propeller repeat protein, partial [Planctomycetota bacterium]
MSPADVASCSPVNRARRQFLTSGNLLGGGEAASFSSFNLKWMIMQPIIYRRWAAFRQFVAISSAALTGFATPASAQEPSWSGFQNGGVIASDAGVPTEWTPETNIAWTAAIEGYGQSTPVVGHGLIVVTSTSGENKDDYHLTAFDAESGKQRWQVSSKNPSPFKNSPMVSRAAPSAIAHSGGFIAFYEGGLVMAVDPKGDAVWERNLVQEYGPIEARHGLAASVTQDKLNAFVWVERSEDPYIVALNKGTGEVAWKSEGVG